MGASKKDIFLKLDVPSALPSIFSGLKVAVTVSVIGAAIGEWLGAQAGLGYFSRRMMTQFDGAAVFAPIVLLFVGCWDCFVFTCHMARKNMFEMEKIIVKKLIGLSISLLVLFMLAACGGQGTTQEESDEESKDLKEVSIMLDWYPNAVHSYLYVAQEKGYFEEEGVAVNIQFPAGPTDPLTLAAAGKVTLGLYYQPDVIMAKANENVRLNRLQPLYNHL